MPNYISYCIDTQGNRTQWEHARKTQAIWRYQFLERGCKWRGADLKEFGWREENA